MAGKITPRFNYEMGYKRAYNYLRHEYPGESETFYHEKSKELTDQTRSSHLLYNVINKYINEYEYSEYLATKIAHHMIDELPIELYPNIEEWIYDEPISEINYYGHSIKKIIDASKNYPIPCRFNDCVEAMIVYIRNGCSTPSVCRDYLVYGHAICEKDSSSSRQALEKTIKEKK